MKVGYHAVVATHNDKSEAFTKAREPERIKSVSDEIEDNEEIEPSTLTNKDTNWDKVKIESLYVNLNFDKH